MATNTAQALAVLVDGRYSDEEIDLIHTAYAKDTTDAEFRHFMAVAIACDLNPLKRQIYAIVRGKGDRRKMVIQTGIDGYRAMAGKTHELAGRDLPAFGPMLAARGGKDAIHPEYAVVTVYRMVHGQRCPFSAIAYWDEYAPYYNDDLGEMWRKMPRGQLAKCAEAQAIRAGFSDETQGVYIAEEMQQADAAALPEARIVEAATVPALPAPAPAEPDETDEATRDHLATFDRRPPAAPSVPHSERAAAGLDLSRAEFIEALSVLGLSPKDAMDKLGVKSLAGLYLREALETLRGSAAPAPTVASAPSAPDPEDEPPPARQDAPARQDEDEPRGDAIPEAFRATGEPDMAFADFLAKCAKILNTRDPKRIMAELGVKSLAGVQYGLALAWLEQKVKGGPAPKRATSGSMKGAPAKSEPGGGVNGRAALRRLALEAGISEDEYLPTYHGLYGEDYAHDTEVAWAVYLQSRIEARKAQAAVTPDLANMPVHSAA